ncbi:hypothetical protein [Deinococcus ruber]|uniref:Uncharacterized protein n=1 Tax=Deinococcus ruber TaxID=1848197 RepID=A0A918F7U0_9DEIO|nr:hypothetical protein [Deinococcus ruber]GGR17122.1 hypothetical protein GCM10008957_32150 [Deinococcus ruber]
MITITGTDSRGEPRTLRVPFLLDEAFDAVALQALHRTPGDLVFASGAIQMRSRRITEEQVRAAGTLCSRWLRQRCLQLQTNGGMRLGHSRWRKITRVEFDTQALDDIRREAERSAD